MLMKKDLQHQSQPSDAVHSVFSSQHQLVHSVSVVNEFEEDHQDTASLILSAIRRLGLLNNDNKQCDYIRRPCWCLLATALLPQPAPRATTRSPSGGAQELYSSVSRIASSYACRYCRLLSPLAAQLRRPSAMLV